MIQANELRIGNWVQYQDHTLIKPELRGKFKQIEVDDITFLVEDVEKANSVIKPIPLTEDILLNNPETFDLNYGAFVKAGECPPSETSYFIDGMKITRVGHSAWDLIGSTGIIARIESVHQLQNLYFALTNKELEIKL